ncbi:MAG TPA: alpha-galactosidase [Verrucomicrobiae bacterium]
MKAIALGVLLSAAVAFGQANYEAASALLSGGAAGAHPVTGLGGAKGGRATFTNVFALRDGLYALDIYFAVNDERSLALTVNGGVRLDLYCEREGPRGKASVKTVLIPLRAGANVIAFDNQGEPGADLERIVLQTNPIPSGSISGVVKDFAGRPLAGVEVSLLGGLDCQTATGGDGLYNFPFVPDGGYHIRPSLPEDFSDPWEASASISNATAIRRDFSARRRARGKKKVLDLGPWRVDYDLAAGAADFEFLGHPVLRDAIAAARLPETVTSLDYKSHKAARFEFAGGIRWQVVCANNPSDRMTQTYSWSRGDNFIAIETEVTRKPAARSRYIAPLIARGQPGALPAGDLRTLFVPYDNDKWARYAAMPFGGETTSYEVSALYDNSSRRGLIVGSLEHDCWKTGVRSSTSPGAIDSLEVFGGVTSPKTRDVLPHGEVDGETIRSPKIFLGCFSDWRDGLEAYADANARLAPRRPWAGGTPFGWNSWGKLQMNINYQKAVEVSDFFARELQPRQFQDDGVVYIGLDSGWDYMSGQQLKQFVAHCHSNHQEAGVYFTPFTSWQGNGDTPVPGTAYRYKDLYLYAHGRKQRIDGGIAMDPTHPGTQKLIEMNARRFREAGFKYVKADFLAQGALEADSHYDPRVTTGLEAYNAGMKFVDAALGPHMFLNLSIAPLFPAQYANSRRIACDAFGAISQTEYTLNSLTSGWWLSRVYDFNDPDQMVFDGYSEAENLSRATSAAVTGLMLAGDDFSATGSESGKQRALRFLGNSEIDSLARSRKSFRPVEGSSGLGSANLFVWDSGPFLYLAAFNYSNVEANYSVDLKRIGLNAASPVEAKELWSGSIFQATMPMSIRLAPAGAALYKFTRP